MLTIKNKSGYVLLFLTFFSFCESIDNKTRNDVLILFDIHNTLVVPRPDRVRTHLECKALGSLLIDALLYTSNRATIIAIMRLLYSGNISGELFYRIFKNNGQEKLAQMVLAISNDYQPIPEMVELVTQLHEHGYNLRVASNIGTLFYTELKKEMPLLFDKFAEGITVQVVDENGNTIDHPIQKPDPLFYLEADRRFNPDGTKRVIFIDDNKMNTRAAAQTCPHWEVILCENPVQVKEDIEKIVGISLNDNPHISGQTN